MDFIINTYALIATIPLLSFFFIYYLLLFFIKERKKALNLTINITSVLFISAVSGQLNYIFKIRYGILYSILAVLFIAAVISFLQWKIKGKNDYKRMIKAVTRLSFISFGFFYFIFFIVSFFRE